ncbi:MAG: low affinity iron permease family protein [Gammaproteobacteria bacterium]
MKELFRKLSNVASAAVGSFWAFIVATAVVGLWAVTGPLFDYSDTWQLVMNTTSSIITFLMVFLIQNTQNRDTMATQLKLDELLRAGQGARTSMVDLESLSDDELERLQNEFHRLRQRAKRAD